MRYAVISDIHGNYPALSAVIEDAYKNGAESFLFLGDYYQDLPFPNQVVDTIKSMKDAFVIRGNKEDYFGWLLAQGPDKWTYDQLAPLYWNCRELRKDNLEYLMRLPDTLALNHGGCAIQLFHSSRCLFGGTQVEELSSSKYDDKMKEKFLSHEEYLQYVRKTLQADHRLLELCGMLEGVYAFGHSHLQWHCPIGNVLLLNPGSCGFPLDFDARAAYTILDITNGAWEVEERRVEYDILQAIDILKASSLYQEAPVWGGIIIRGLETAREEISCFLKFASSLAREEGEEANPVSNRIWGLAAEKWENGQQTALKCR